MNTNEIMKMKYADITTVDKSQLVDIDTIKINPKDPPEKKIKEYIAQVRNPYCFLCNGYVVKLEFSESGKTIEDCFIDYLNTLV